MGEDSLCFVTFSLQFKHPKAVIYKEVDGDRADVPWLYLPFPSSGESWLFHPIQPDTDTMFTCIPEINCLIPSVALRMHINMANAKAKTVALKMLWVGQDSKKRQGLTFDHFVCNMECSMNESLIVVNFRQYLHFAGTSECSNLWTVSTLFDDDPIQF